MAQEHYKERLSNIAQEQKYKKEYIQGMNIVMQNNINVGPILKSGKYADMN